MTSTHTSFNAIDSTEDDLYENIHNLKKTTASGSALRQILSQMRIGMDLTQFSCPPFILRPVSLLEMNADNMAPLEDLCNAYRQDSPIQRMLSITQWLLAGCSCIPQPSLQHCKPFNPILGEKFHCYWLSQNNSKTEYYAEQVSHHPPVSVCTMFNNDAHFKITCVTQPKITFLGNSVEMKLTGSYALTLTNLDEDYEITLPSGYISGLIFGTSKVECGKQLLVKCNKTGVEVKIDIKSKNEVRGVLTFNQKQIYKIHGDLHGRIFYKDDRDHLLIDHNNTNKPKKYVTPLAESEPKESRKIWHNVSKAIFEDDLDTCSHLKNEIEAEQRIIRKQQVYEPQWFVKREGHFYDDVPLYDFVLPQ